MIVRVIGRSIRSSGVVLDVGHLLLHMALLLAYVWVLQPNVKDNLGR